MNKKKLNIIRIALPLACFSIQLLSGHSVGKSIWFTCVTALFTCLAAAAPIGIGLLCVYPVLCLYNLRIESKNEKLLDFKHPTNRFSLYFSITCILIISLIIARKF